MSIFLVDAFTNTPFAGNRAGVVLDQKHFTDELKQKIAAELNASETVFAVQNETSTFDARYFTPTTEIDFCGHATIALFYTLAKENKVQFGSDGIELLVKTKAGDFPVRVRKVGDEILVSLRQTESHFAPVPFTVQGMARALRLPLEAFDLSFPLGLAKTGNWHLMVGLKNRTYLDQIDYDTKALSDILNQSKAVTAHVFCPGNEVNFHARNFCPTIGIPEDPATGSAAGAFAAYLVHENLIPDGKHHISIVQGEKMGRESHISLEIEGYNRVLQQVEITGTAVTSFQLLQP